MASFLLKSISVPLISYSQNTQKSEKLHNLNSRYQSSCYEYSNIAKDEQVRRSRVREVLLEDENTNLRERITQKDHQFTLLFAKCEKLRSQLEVATRRGRQHEKQARLQGREIANLKVCCLVCLVPGWQKYWGFVCLFVLYGLTI